jgi:hypothetical protein
VATLRTLEDIDDEASLKRLRARAQRP